jgi:hypothetical protein
VSELEARRARKQAVKALAAQVPPMTDSEIAATGALYARLDEAAAALGRREARAS